MSGLHVCIHGHKTTNKHASWAPLFLYLVRVEDVEDELHLVRVEGGGSMGSMSVSLAAEAFLTHVRSGQCGQETCVLSRQGPEVGQ